MDFGLEKLAHPSAHSSAIDAGLLDLN